jgi:CheY-like chemotaxis protein
VVTARNGHEALEVIEKEQPALIITDILMPKMDGFGLVHRLRINPATRQIPVVFLSATYVAPEDKAFALTIGVTRFIEKPVNFENFLPAISELLNQVEQAAPEPLNDDDFYAGYRKRLQEKLDHKNTQITRAEHLLQTVSEEEKASINASLHAATSEREDIKRLLDDINDRMENKPE